MAVLQLQGMPNMKEGQRDLAVGLARPYPQPKAYCQALEQEGKLQQAMSQRLVPWLNGNGRPQT